MDSLKESIKYTYDDLLAFPDDGKRREIIDGELYVSPSPKPAHQIVVGNLHFLIRGYLVAHPLGQLFLSPLDVVFSKFDVVDPDLLFISNARRHVVTESNVAGSPDLAIEVLSRSSRRTDEVKKRKLYERFEVVEYWIVDPDLKTVKVYRRANAGERRERIGEYHVEAADAVTSPIFPGLELPLPRIFESLPAN